MDSLPGSPIEAINAAIQSHNPFKNAGIVTEQNVWGKGFPDLASLNKKASDAIFKAVEQVKTSQASHEKVTTIAITAPQGAGKTHSLSRIRHRLERDGGGLFVYAGTDKYTDLNLIKYQFQQTLADSLKYRGSQEVMQWQEVAAAMANEGFKASNPNAQPLAPKQLVNRFDQVYANWLARNKNLMEYLTKQVSKAKPNTDPYILRAILWTLSENYVPFAIRWLSGEGLDQSTAEYMGLPANSNKTNQDREAEALTTILQILNLVSYRHPVIICFDQLESLKVNEAGLTTPQVIAELVSSLYNTLSQSELGQGVVIITVMLPDIWINTIDLMVGGIPDRTSTYTKRKPIELKPLNGQSIVELVSLWLKEELYEPRKLTPPHPVYPFEESQLLELGKGKLTVRELLGWCAENFKVYSQPLPEKPVERFELALMKELEADFGDYLEKNELIGEALRFGFQTLKGKSLEGETMTGQALKKITIEDVAEIQPKIDNKGYINFKVICTENGKDVKIGVAVNQPAKGGSLQACLERLTDYQKFDLTRGCLVRSPGRKIRRNAESYRLLNRLTSELGGELVELVEEQIRPLIALQSVYDKRKDYDLTEKQIFKFIDQKKLTLDNPLLREILSDPSGGIDENMLEDIYNDFANFSKTDETNETDDTNPYDEFS